MGRVHDEFKAGQESAKIAGLSDALLRAILVGAAAAVAIFSPVSIWAKVLIFFLAMFVVGVLVQIFKLYRFR